MKKSVLNFSALIVAAMLLFISCKKDKAEPEPVDNGAAIAHASDEAAVNEESDQIADDGGGTMETNMSGARSGARVGVALCGASSVEVAPDNRSAVITYTNATSCDGKRIRNGMVTVALTSVGQWRDKDAVMTIFTEGLTIKRSDGKIIKIKGTHVVTNLSGGLVKDLITNPAAIIVHDIKAVQMSITLENNGAVRTWDAHRKRTISRNESGLAIKIEGADAGNVAARGINKAGEAFVTIISQPLMANSCNGLSTEAKWNVIDGIKSHSVSNKTITVSYGYDASKVKVANCSANTIKINYEGSKGSAEGFHTYK